MLHEGQTCMSRPRLFMNFSIWFRADASAHSWLAMHAACDQRSSVCPRLSQESSPRFMPTAPPRNAPAVVTKADTRPTGVTCSTAAAPPAPSAPASALQAPRGTSMVQSLVDARDVPGSTRPANTSKNNIKRILFIVALLASRPIHGYPPE